MNSVPREHVSCAPVTTEVTKLRLKLRPKLRPKLPSNEVTTEVTKLRLTTEVTTGSHLGWANVQRVVHLISEPHSVARLSRFGHRLEDFERLLISQYSIQYASLLLYRYNS